MRVALDAMGGDSAPREVVAGAVLAIRKNADLRVTLVGDRERVATSVDEVLVSTPVADAERVRGNVSYLHTSQMIPMNAPPVESLRKNPDASVARAAQLVKEGGADALVTAGNTGAAVAATHQALGRLKGIRRPGIAALFPTNTESPAVVIDVGATVKCQPVHLHHFGIMGSVFAETVLGITRPRVGLLNIGEEDEKGNELVKRTHELFRASELNFLGNVEGQDIFSGRLNVIVCEGFVGNVVLKVTEGLAGSLTQFVERVLAGKPAVQSRSLLASLKERTDFASYGGAILLGVNGLCIIGHGRSDRRAIASAVALATRYVEARATERIIQGLGSTSETQATPVP